MDLFLFGDQGVSQEPLLKTLAGRKDNGLLVTFIERSVRLLKDEIRALPRSRRDLMPDFLVLSHLVEGYVSKGLKVPELESSLLAVSQLGHFIA